MARETGAKAPRVKVQEHRDRLRAQGLRPIQIWVPDVLSRAQDDAEKARVQMAQRRRPTAP